jgi:hypothetical protein
MCAPLLYFLDNLMFVVHLSFSSSLCPYSWLYTLAHFCLYSVGFGIQSFSRYFSKVALGLDSSCWLIQIRSHIHKIPWCKVSIRAQQNCLVFNKRRKVYFDCQGHWEVFTMNNILIYLWSVWDDFMMSLSSLETTRKLKMYKQFPAVFCLCFYEFSEA